MNKFTPYQTMMMNLEAINALISNFTDASDALGPLQAREALAILEEIRSLYEKKRGMIREMNEKRKLIKITLKVWINKKKASRSPPPRTARVLGSKLPVHAQNTRLAIEAERARLSLVVRLQNLKAV